MRSGSPAATNPRYDDRYHRCLGSTAGTAPNCPAVAKFPRFPQTGRTAGTKPSPAAAAWAVRADVAPKERRACKRDSGEPTPRTKQRPLPSRGPRHPRCDTSASRMPTTSLTEFCTAYAATPSGRAERPKPRESGAITRKPFLTRNGIWLRQRDAESGHPWSKSTGLPLPRSSTAAKFRQPVKGS